MHFTKRGFPWWKPLAAMEDIIIFQLFIELEVVMDDIEMNSGSSDLLSSLLAILSIVCKKPHQSSVSPASIEEACVEYVQSSNAHIFYQEEQSECELNTLPSQDEFHKLDLEQAHLKSWEKHQVWTNKRNKQVQHRVKHDGFIETSVQQLQQAAWTNNQVQQQGKLHGQPLQLARSENWSQVQQQDGFVVQSLQQSWTKNWVQQQEDIDGFVVQQQRMSEKQEDLHGFVETVVQTFKHQRKHGYQFAVLLLLPHRISRKFVLLTQSGEATEATNCSYPSYPLEKDVCNFIVARPDNYIHAEVLLLRQISSLMRRNIEQCRTIVLYTWLFPCDNCKQEIINALKVYTKKYRVVLMYTSRMREMHDSEVMDITLELQKAGIEVRKETYDHKLERL